MIDTKFNFYLEQYKQTLESTVDDQPLWNDYIKNVVVISKYSKDSPELENIRLIEKHKNINIQKFDAIYPTEPHISFKSIGAYGCALSHYNVIKIAKENNWENVMILEDDVILHKYFNKYFNYIVDEIKTLEWDLLYGFKNRPKEKEKIKILTYFNTINKIYGMFSTHCYCINKKTYNIIINQYDNILINCPPYKKTSAIDEIYKYNKKINKYVPKINLAGYILRYIHMSSSPNPFYLKELINVLRKL